MSTPPPWAGPGQGSFDPYARRDPDAAPRVDPHAQVPPQVGPYRPAPDGHAPCGAPMVAPARPAEGMAVAALVAGVVSLLTTIFVVGPIAIGLGTVALRRIRVTGAEGRGMAIAGIVTGGVATLTMVVLAALLAVRVLA